MISSEPGQPHSFSCRGFTFKFEPCFVCAAVAAVHGIPYSLPSGGIWPVEVFALAYIMFIIDLGPPLNSSPSGWGKTPFLSFLPSLPELLEFSHLVTSAEGHPGTSPPACCTPALPTPLSPTLLLAKWAAVTLARYRDVSELGPRVSCHIALTGLGFFAGSVSASPHLCGLPTSLG